MSELKNQAKQKPQIEEIAPDYLDGDVLGNLLDFFAWMRANRMAPTFVIKARMASIIHLMSVNKIGSWGMGNMDFW